MAKRNRQKNTQQPLTSATKSLATESVTNGLSATANLLKEDDSADHGLLAVKLKSAFTSHGAANEEQKTKLAASLDNDIQALVGELKKSIEINKRLEAEQKSSEARTKQLEEAAEKTKKQIENDKKALEKELKELAQSRKAHTEEKSELAKRLEVLKEQELEAECGFATKHMSILEKFEEDKEALTEKLELRKVELEKEIEELRQSKRSLTQEEKTIFDEQLSALTEKENAIADKEIALKQELIKVERKQKLAELSSEEAEKFKDTLRTEVRTEFLQKISSAENQIQLLNNQIQKYTEAESKLLEKISAYNDLQRQFGDSSPDQVLKEIQTYKSRVEELTQELNGKPSQQIESLYKELKKRYESLEQEYNSNQAELQENKALRYKNQMSVLELEQIEKQKQAISKHNELLKVAVDKLSNEVDELINKQQSQTAFPALLELDAKLRSRATTENIPSLSTFAKELQQRIAWDEKENKELYYRIEDIHLFIAGLAMSRLHILQGISGTGKTSLAKAFARAVGGACKTIYVQAGWRDKSDLVGHFNAFEKKFYELETLQGLYEAQCPFYEDRPYVILLDEMNLSRPEQYFAQFLSALEMDPNDRILDLMTTSTGNSPKLLIDGRKIKIPKNVWFIGTANHDETTFEFADKTYDRAHVMELPRHSTRFEVDKNLEQVAYSYSSLEDAFELAEDKHRASVQNLIAALDKSMLAQYLEEDFNVSWV
jgi:DNA repair exonuclease SbcCD ATPase subunit